MIELDGKWKVTAIGLTPWRVLNRLNDVKVINGKVGFNEVTTGRWGFFDIRQLGPATVILDYDRPENNEPLRKIHDILKMVNENLWKGQFFYRLGIGAPIKVFDFKLDRI